MRTTVHIGLFLCLLATAVPSAVAKKEKPLPPCEQGHGVRHKMKTRAALIREVTSRLEANQAARVLKYMSCDFIVGLPESDIVRTLPPEKALPGLIKATKDLKWEPTGVDHGTQVNIAAREGQSEHRHELVLRGDPSGWYWAGYATTDESVLKAFKADLYPELQNGE